MDIFTVLGTFGPMAYEVDSLVLAMRVLWDGFMFDLDRLIPPLKFDMEVNILHS